MSLPQINHTQISNQFIDYWMSRVSPSATVVFLAIARKTIGWHKETDKISQGQLIELSGLTKKTVKAAIAELKRNGLISANMTGKGRGIITEYEINYTQVNNGVKNNGLNYTPINNDNGVKIDPLEPDNGVKITPTKDININKEYKERARKIFKKPKQEEIKEYCKEIGYSLNPAFFLDYYESKGWLIGKTNMKDWKAAIRNWKRRDKQTDPIRVEIKKCPVCHGDMPGTLATCGHCGYSIGDDIYDKANLSFYDSNQRRKKAG